MDKDQTAVLFVILASFAGGLWLLVDTAYGINYAYAEEWDCLLSDRYPECDPNRSQDAPSVKESGSGSVICFEASISTECSAVLPTTSSNLSTETDQTDSKLTLFDTLSGMFSSWWFLLFIVPAIMSGVQSVFRALRPRRPRPRTRSG